MAWASETAAAAVTDECPAVVVVALVADVDDEGDTPCTRE
jgi:hypothetical protein